MDANFNPKGLPHRSDIDQQELYLQQYIDFVNAIAKTENPARGEQLFKSALTRLLQIISLQKTSQAYSNGFRALINRIKTCFSQELPQTGRIFVDFVETMQSRVTAQAVNRIIESYQPPMLSISDAKTREVLEMFRSGHIDDAVANDWILFTIY